MAIATIFSAYCACKVCCGPAAIGIATDGQKPIAGRTVAASRSIPLGTRIRITIPGNPHWQNRVVVVTDRLAKKYDGKRIDIFYNTHHSAKQFGIQHGTYTIHKQSKRK